MDAIRVFPRRTQATPEDGLAFVGPPPMVGLPPRDLPVFVSVAFTWDIARGQYLNRVWRQAGYNTKISGPAFGADPAGYFVPGMFVRTGMTITSRGCIRKCPWCFVPPREGNIRTLPIVAGHDILDNNLLACPRQHVEQVLDMLEEQKHPARFTGGIDARLVEPWFVERVSKMRLDILYTAFDSPSQWDSTNRAIVMFRYAGIRQRAVGCFVLVGYKDDTVQHAVDRLNLVLEAGGTPYAMYYRGEDESNGTIPDPWADVVRQWSRPALIFHKDEPPTLPFQP